jgi:hypothetical protein
MAWLKWMIYEDPADAYKTTYVRSGFPEEAWRLYFKTFGSQPAPQTSSTYQKYLSVTRYDMNTPAAVYLIYQLPANNTEYFYAGYLDLSSTNLATEYQQLLPQNVTYVGFGYMDANPSLVSNDTRLYYTLYAFRVPDQDISYTIQKPDLESPPVDAPIAYIKKKGLIVNNVTGTPLPTPEVDVLGTVAKYLYPSNYTYLINVSTLVNIPFKSFSNLTNITVAPLWNSYGFVNVSMTDVPMNVSVVGNWTVYAWSNATAITVNNQTLYLANVTLAVSPATGDFIITFNNVTSDVGTLFMGLYANNTNDVIPDTFTILANTTNGEVNGLLSWAGLTNGLRLLNGTSIIMISKGYYRMVVSGPYCVPIPPEMGGLGSC